MPLSLLFNTNNKGAAKAASGKENMKAIFIDAVNRKVEEVQVENNLQSLCEKIGCKRTEVRKIGNFHTLLFDKEGLEHDVNVGFDLPQMGIVIGNALVVKDNGNGGYEDTILPVSLFALAINFLDLLNMKSYGPIAYADLGNVCITNQRVKAYESLLNIIGC